MKIEKTEREVQYTITLSAKEMEVLGKFFGGVGGGYASPLTLDSGEKYYPAKFTAAESRMVRELGSEFYQRVENKD